MTGDASTTALTSRLGYLLKHVHLRFTEASAQALAPFGVDGRELAVLAVLAADRPLSQMEAAIRIGVDRTTMVALVDALEGKGLVARRRSTEHAAAAPRTAAATRCSRLRRARNCSARPNSPARRRSAASSPRSPARTPTGSCARCGP